MKFYGKITTCSHYEDAWNPETTELYAEHFEANSIQSAKAKLSSIANTQELFSWIQSWDNEKRTFTGKDLRWKPWSPPVAYDQEDGTPIGYSSVCPTGNSEKAFTYPTINTGKALSIV